MNFKNLSYWEVVGITVCILIFLILTSVVLFKSELLDPIFFTPEVEKQEEVLEAEQNTEPEILEFVEGETYAKLDVVASEGSGLLYINLEKEAGITGLELFLEKDQSLNIVDFVCEAPFECALVDIQDTEVSILAVIPPDSVNDIPVGDLLVGKFDYTGTGNLYLKPLSKTFVSAIEDPVFNILDISGSEFLLK